MVFDSVAAFEAYVSENLKFSAANEGKVKAAFAELQKLEAAQPAAAVKFARMLAAAYATPAKKVQK